jgi:hypothetical protein
VLYLLGTWLSSVVPDRIGVIVNHSIDEATPVTRPNERIVHPRLGSNNARVDPPKLVVVRRDERWHDVELRARRRDLDGSRGYVCYALLRHC